MYIGYGLVQVLVRNFTPSPQVLEHEPQLDHDDHCPSTGQLPAKHDLVSLVDPVQGLPPSDGAGFEQVLDLSEDP